MSLVHTNEQLGAQNEQLGAQLGRGGGRIACYENPHSPPSANSMPERRKKRASGKDPADYKRPGRRPGHGLPARVARARADLVARGDRLGGRRRAGNVPVVRARDPQVARAAPRARPRRMRLEPGGPGPAGGAPVPRRSPARPARPLPGHFPAPPPPFQPFLPPPCLPAQRAVRRRGVWIVVMGEPAFQSLHLGLLSLDGLPEPCDLSLCLLAEFLVGF